MNQPTETQPTWDLHGHLSDLGPVTWPPVASRGEVAELQQIIKERDAEIENYEEVLKQPTMDAMDQAGFPGCRLSWVYVRTL